MEKKVIIIGGGISGLTAGIYARLQGFDVDLYESHSVPGGMCTGWNRKGYNIDGCIHWMMGTSKDSRLYKIWERCGALSDDTEIINHDILVSCKDNEKIYHLYRDTDKMEAELLRISSEDKEEIEQLMEYIRSWSGIEMIPSGKPADMMTENELVALGDSYAKALEAIRFGNKYSVDEYAGRFCSPVIRKLLLTALSTGYNKAGVLFSMLQTRSSGNGGWPEGGSLEMMKRMAARFTSLGGKLYLKTLVTEIVIDAGCATGVKIAGADKTYKADYIIPATDMHVLLKVLLKDRYPVPYFEQRFNDPENYLLLSGTLIAFGVDADLSKRPHCLSFEPEEPLFVGGKRKETIIAEHYCFDSRFSLKGKSTVQFLINDYNYDYWQALKAISIEKYKAEKKRLSDILSRELQRLYPETTARIEMTDVCTPTTFNRYCGAYKGAYMSFLATANTPVESYAGTIGNIGNLYPAGQFLYPDGGLPQALISGKFAVQRLCNTLNIRFID